MRKIMALILAGGKGTRMDVLCQLRPKPALPFAGKYRVMDFSLTNCVHSKVTDIAVLVDYQRDYMREYLQEWRLANAGALDLDILPPSGGSYAGTADAVYQNLDYLETQGVDTVLVLAGDHVYRMDYRRMIDFHRAVNADVTVGVVKVPDEAHRFGTVTLDNHGRIQEFLEKSPFSRSELVSMGIYVFNLDTLAKRLSEDAADPLSTHDFGYAVLPKAVKRERVFAYQYDGYWQDIGTTDAYYLANMELLSVAPRFSLNGGWNILGENVTPALRTEDGEGDITNSLVSPGCYIRGRVINSVLSPGVHVAEQAVVRDSILMADTVVGYHSIIERSIIDEGAKIGKFCYIGFGLGLNARPEGVGATDSGNITVLGKGVTVPDCTAIGRRCKVMQGVGPAAFDTNMLSSGTILTRP